VMESMRVTDEIFEVGGGSLTSPEDAAVYLIAFDDHAALVDAGCGGSPDRLMDNIRRCNVKARDIEYLLITHCHYDHTGGVAKLKEMTQCQVVAHELDARYLERGDDTVTAAKWYGASLDPFVIDRKLSMPREEIHLGDRLIQAIHTPGHSPGSVVYVTESQGLKVLFGQDVHGPLDPGLLSNRDDYLGSLDLLLTLEADILCEGHYGVIRGKGNVSDFIRSFMRV
jgi:glyoxylase-like metal-dependent hydrolase (beta-lactamase superfamily II)